MEGKINELAQQMNTLMEKVSNLEKNAIFKNSLNEEIICSMRYLLWKMKWYLKMTLKSNWEQ